MTLELRISDARDIPRVNDALHDRWFDLDAIYLNPIANALEIPFGERKAPQPSSIFRIEHVREYELDDTEGIGSYPFNVVRYDEEQRALEILTSIPLRFLVLVNRLELVIAPIESQSPGGTASGRRVMSERERKAMGGSTKQTLTGPVTNRTWATLSVIDLSIRWKEI